MHLLIQRGGYSEGSVWVGSTEAGTWYSAEPGKSEEVS